MALGTSAGLLTSRGDHPQSVFKHEVLRRYLEPFAGMTGAQNDRGRVVIVDGYAGTGRYDSGEPASAELVMQTALRFTRRHVRSFFVEAKKSNFAKLNRVVGEYQARGVDAVARYGQVEHHLSEIVAHAQETPLFMFLDPCGAALPFRTLTGLLGRDRRAARPPTEVLLNFSAEFTRRTVGALVKGQRDHPGVAALDVSCGGPWWHRVALAAHTASADPSFEAAAERVAEAYADRLARAVDALPVVIPVRKRLHHQPIYHLVFLTRSRYGEWVFSNSVALARRVWMRHLDAEPDDPDDAEQLALFGDELRSPIELALEEEAADAVGRVERNLAELVGRVASAKLVHHAPEVLRGVCGVATEAEIRLAVTRLEHAGLLARRKPHPSRVRDWVVERRGPSTGDQTTQRIA